MSRYGRTLKFNENHDARGRFTFGEGAKPSVLAADHRSVTLYHVNGDQEQRTGGSQSWRNNNPGNIRSGSFATAHGAIGSANGFAVFATEQDGASALDALMASHSYAILTIDQAISKFSPSTENDPAQHARNITRIAGLSGSQTIASLTRDQFRSFTAAIRVAEGWKIGDARRKTP